MNTARASRNTGSVHSSGAVAASRRLPVAGKLRAGVKVLTKAAAGNAALVAIYNEGVASGASFDDIAAAISKVKGAPTNPMAPRNVPWFTARQGDFATPGAAAVLLDLYGEVRHGDPGRHIYALPIIFPSDDMDLVFREQFEAWKATELMRWSEPDPETGVLQCMKRVEQAPEKAARRRWGGRPTEAERPCNPNDCALFDRGECKHVASLSFWVPGVTGTGVIELMFTSVYASMGIAETLDMVRAGLGRISGLHNGKPIFWLSKGRERVSRMNWETGKPEKTDQWIIRLEASGLDMVEVLGCMGAQAALAAPETAKALEGPARPVDVSNHAPDAKPIHVEPQGNSRYGAAQETAQETAQPTSTTDPGVAPANTVRELRAQLSALRDTLGWEDADLKEWVDGQGYKCEAPAKDAVCLADMVAGLTAAAEARARREAAAAADVGKTKVKDPGVGETVDLDLVPDDEVPF